MEISGSSASFRHISYVIRLCDELKVVNSEKNIIIVFCASNAAPPICVDFVPHWPSVFISRLAEEFPLFSVIQATSSPTLTTLSTLLHTRNWTDLLDIKSVDVFGVISSSIGVLGCAAMLCDSETRRKEVANVVFSMLQDSHMKATLETLVF